MLREVVMSAMGRKRTLPALLEERPYQHPYKEAANRTEAGPERTKQKVEPACGAELVRVLALPPPDIGEHRERNCEQGGATLGGPSDCEANEQPGNGASHE